MDQHLTYVAMSRHRHAVQLYWRHPRVCFDTLQPDGTQGKLLVHAEAPYEHKAGDREAVPQIGSAIRLAHAEPGRRTEAEVVKTTSEGPTSDDSGTIPLEMGFASGLSNGGPFYSPMLSGLAKRSGLGTGRPSSTKKKTKAGETGDG
jgi:hypothetical protein